VLDASPLLTILEPVDAAMFVPVILLLVRQSQSWPAVVGVIVTVALFAVESPVVTRAVVPLTI
jgi:hypothetical protein